MNRAYPCIKICDIETSISWYIDFLGFRCIYKNSLNTPDFAILEKGEIKIHLIRDESSEAYASNVIVIEVEDLETEYKSQQDAGVIIIQQIGNGIFSENEFVIKDYEDNKIVYKQKT